MKDHSTPTPLPDDLVLFDGVCNLCHWSVNFIIDRDPAGRYHFASLQSAAGRAVLESHGLPPNYTDSVLLLRDGQLYARSEAALRIARHLAGGWPLLYAFMVVPRPLRDAAYKLIARYRYRLFGQDACRLPTPALKARILA